MDPAARASAPDRHAGCLLVGSAHRQLSDGLRDWLQASFDAVFVVADRGSLIDGARRLQPVLVLVDLALAEGRLAALTAELRRHAPRCRTLVLVDHDDAQVTASVIAAGADASVCLYSLAADLCTAIDAVLAGPPSTPPDEWH